MLAIDCNAALCTAPYGTGGATGAPGAPQKIIGAPGSMLIGFCVPGRKLSPVTCKGAAVPVLIRST